MRTPLLLLVLTFAGAARAAEPVPTPPALEVVAFDEAVRRAVQRAPSARIAAAEVARVEALLWEIRAGALPLVSANATYTRTDEARTAPAAQRNASLSLSAPLLAPSRWYQWSHAADQVDVAEAGARDVRRAVALTAARAYLTVVSQKRAVEVSRRAVRTAAAHYEYAHTRRRGGVGNALDEARADQQLATAEAQLENALAGLARAQEALGLSAGAPAPLDAGAEPDLGGGPATPAEGTSGAEETRTDVLLSRERLRAARRLAEDSWADWLPTVSLQATTFLQDPPTTAVPEHGWQVQLVASLPLFDGGFRIGQGRERGALARQAEAALDAALAQARADVRTAFSNLARAEAALAHARRGAQQANAALAIVQQAFRAGATTSLDVTDAERTARDADGAAVVAEDAVRQARLDLLAATGRFPEP
ncbi:MAG TPA: TolC family protein [Anaeromyxobacter sp.]|nr:TolC family protein [Anaeromyxobacter sp.]